ncbi:hypothetical protein TWF718_009245 [Orbilia javanica]|uniref:Peptidase A1 domain-containing protein n=1 Tax=Orbilia javanica TaxID=47235 RepID=A0AAN8MP64_9PEZI
MTSSIGPSFTETLNIQGVTGGQTIGFYNVLDTKSPGQVLFGALDRSKFHGKFEIYDWRRGGNISALGGVVGTAPTVRFGNINDATKMSEDFFARRQLSAQINPFAYAIYLPDYIFLPLVDQLRLFGIVETITGTHLGKAGDEIPISERKFSLPCNVDIPRQYVLEFRFNAVAIRVPFNDLVFRDAPDPDSPDFCKLAFYGFYAGSGTNRIAESMILGGPFFKAAYVVIDPEKQTTAVAILSRNDTVTEIVELGGYYGSNLKTVQGNGADPYYSVEGSPDEKKLPLPLGALIGIGVGGGLLLIAMVALGIFFWRRRKAKKVSDILAPKSSMVEVDPKGAELDAIKSEIPIPEAPGIALDSGNHTFSNPAFNTEGRHELPNNPPRRELDVNTRLLQEIP